MASNIALDKSSQSTFTKAVKNIKTLIKKNELKVNEQGRKPNVAGKGKGKRHVLGKGKQASKPTWKRHGKGVVYLSHIPKGFYEKEMMSYFSQFGMVTRLNLVRSKKNGNPKGYAFIEFMYSEVAQVVAETMNNYLMCGRILKAEYIPGDQVRDHMFTDSGIRPGNCPQIKKKGKWVQKMNKKLTPAEEKAEFERESKHIDKVKKQLEESGINLDFQ